MGSFTSQHISYEKAPQVPWLALMPHLCVLPSQPDSLCSSTWQNTPFCHNCITQDISIILLFTFYQPLFYATHDQHFPSESEEKAGYWVGFGEHCGDAMTHNLLDHETQKIIYRSAVRPKKSSTPNDRLAPHGGEVSPSSNPSEDKISSGSPWDPQKVPCQNRRPLQSSSGSEMMRIHLDPSLCQLLTQKISLGGHFFCLLKKMVKGTEPR